MLKQYLAYMARALKLLSIAEWGRYLWVGRGFAADNRAYLAQHPDTVRPPLWWMHDMYSHTSYRAYEQSGKDSARELVDLIGRHWGDASVASIGDWGCGLGRVISKMPDQSDLVGWDLNADAIDWCSANLEGIRFFVCEMMPPTELPGESLDVVYSISVFTHLGEEAGKEWVAEIARLLKPGGIFICTFHGHSHIDRLLPWERSRFENGDAVFRDGVPEGARIFTSYHPEQYIRNELFKDFEILDGPFPLFGQEGWVLRKPESVG